MSVCQASVQIFIVYFFLPLWLCFDQGLKIPWYINIATEQTHFRLYNWFTICGNIGKIHIHVADYIMEPYSVRIYVDGQQFSDKKLQGHMTTTGLKQSTEMYW